MFPPSFQLIPDVCDQQLADVQRRLNIARSQTNDSRKVAAINEALDHLERANLLIFEAQTADPVAA